VQKKIGIGDGGGIAGSAGGLGEKPHLDGELLPEERIGLGMEVRRPRHHASEQGQIWQRRRPT